MNEVILKKAGAIAHVTINREKAYNALNSSVLAGLEKIFSELEKDRDIVVVIISGAGQKAFVAGADVKEIQDAGDKRPELIAKGQKIISSIRNSSKVVIAAVRGYALGGGCELALACDLIIASEDSRFGFPEAKLGLMPGYGGTQLLPRLIGIGKAKYMIFSGKMLKAKEAFQFGLLEKICPGERLMEEVEELATQISSNGPYSLKAIKRAIHGGIEVSIEEALKLELEEYAKVARSEDAEEGLKSFIEKRDPKFKGS